MIWSSSSIAMSIEPPSWNIAKETSQRTYWYYKVVASLMFFDAAVQLLDATITVDKWQSLQI
jgi:hypothetical protein